MELQPLIGSSCPPHDRSELVAAIDAAILLLRKELLLERILPLGKPAIVGLQCGHGKVHVTIPVGVEARLDTTEPSLTLKEIPVD